MPSEKHPKAKSVESLRHAEYYGMQRTFDELYARSQAGEVFDNLMELILSKDNIMLAYRNIKSNSGSATPGTDRLRITDIGRLPADEVVARVRKIVRGGTNGYTPRSVRRKEIPKPNGKTRPLGRKSMAEPSGYREILLQGKCSRMPDTQSCVPGYAEYKPERNVYRAICG